MEFKVGLSWIIFMDYLHVKRNVWCMILYIFISIQKGKILATWIFK